MRADGILLDGATCPVHSSGRHPLAAGDNYALLTQPGLVELGGTRGILLDDDLTETRYGAAEERSLWQEAMMKGVVGIVALIAPSVSGCYSMQTVRTVPEVGQIVEVRYQQPVMLHSPGARGTAGGLVDSLRKEGGAILVGVDKSIEIRVAGTAQAASSLPIVLLGVHSIQGSVIHFDSNTILLRPQVLHTISGIGQSAEGGIVRVRRVSVDMQLRRRQFSVGRTALLIGVTALIVATVTYEPFTCCDWGSISENGARARNGR